jgi:hypothetical protein
MNAVQPIFVGGRAQAADTIPGLDSASMRRMAGLGACGRPAATVKAIAPVQCCGRARRNRAASDKAASASAFLTQHLCGLLYTEVCSFNAPRWPGARTCDEMHAPGPSPTRALFGPGGRLGRAATRNLKPGPMTSRSEADNLDCQPECENRSIFLSRSTVLDSQFRLQTAMRLRNCDETTDCDEPTDCDETTELR